MSKKYFLLLFTTIALYTSSDAQVFIGGRLGGAGYYGRPRPRRRVQQSEQNLPKFQPAVYISIGYGFPNLDKYQMPVYYNYFTGSATQTGPVTGAIDYQFNRSM